MSKMFDIFKKIAVPLFIHKKRESNHIVLTEAEVQDASGNGIFEGDIVKVYVGDDGKVWIRKVEEFEDGRFQSIGDIPVSYAQTWIDIKN